VSSSFRGTLISINVDGTDGTNGKGCRANSVFSMTGEREQWIWRGELIIAGLLDSVVVVKGGGDNLRSSHRKTSISSDRAVDVA
jgi:hypothetical protein